MTAYLETSFLVSLYTLDSNSASAVAAVQSSGGPFPLTSFGELELINAIELRQFRREITSAQAKLGRVDLSRDLRAGLFQRAPTTPAVYKEALRLAHSHTARLGVRSLDILHVASALELGFTAFYTFDKRQGQLARAAGLTLPLRLP